MNKTRKMVLTALLIAIAIVIPVSCGFLRVIIGPFTATIGSHIPMFIAMLISTKVAAIVGIGSGIGFLFAGMPIFVVFRALMHIPVGILGAWIVEKGGSLKSAMIKTSLLHGVLEGLVVIPFGFKLYEVVIVTIVGTILHHFADSGISLVLCKKVAGAMRKDMYLMFK